MGFLSFFGALSPAHINFFTFMSRGKMVGSDILGNRYFQAPPRKGGYKRPRRWVLYKGKPEASNVPPEWHGWLHHQTDIVPSKDGESYRQTWQKPHQANMTGTHQAYFPPGYSGERDRSSADYEAWVPDPPAIKAKQMAETKTTPKKKEKSKATAKKQNTQK